MASGNNNNPFQEPYFEPCAVLVPFQHLREFYQLWIQVHLLLDAVSNLLVDDKLETLSRLASIRQEISNYLVSFAGPLVDAIDKRILSVIVR